MTTIIRTERGKNTHTACHWCSFTEIDKKRQQNEESKVVESLLQIEDTRNWNDFGWIADVGGKGGGQVHNHNHHTDHNQ